MPNYCSNEITITGPKADIERLLDQANATHQHYCIDYRGVGYTGEWKDVLGMLWAFMPPPAEIRTPDRYFAVRDDDLSDKREWWYNWNVDHWNTKWDVGDATIDLIHDDPDEAVARIGFESAWSAPTPVTIAMSEQYPTLEFTHEYWEEGAGFRGELAVSDAGENILEHMGDTDHDWWAEKFGGCREVEYGGLEEGEACPTCGEIMPMTPEFIFFGAEN